MSFVNVIPDAIATAATDLTNIGTALNEVNTAAHAAIGSVIPAAADEVSAALAELFNAHGAWWQELAQAAQAFHTQFTGLLNTAANLYHSVEDANAQSMLQPGYYVTGNIIHPNGTWLQPVGQGEDLFHVGF